MPLPGIAPLGSRSFPNGLRTQVQQHVQRMGVVIQCMTLPAAVVQTQVLVARKVEVMAKQVVVARKVELEEASTRKSDDSPLQLLSEIGGPLFVLPKPFAFFFCTT